MKTSSDKVQHVQVRYFDEWSKEIPGHYGATSVRVSVYFDEHCDNHHFELRLPATRHQIAVALSQLSKLVVKDVGK